MKPNAIPPSCRMKKTGDYARVYGQRLRASDEWLLIYASANALGDTRFGLSVSRKLGGSVARSRLKRLLREAFRLSRHELPRGLDLIVIPQAGGCRRASLHAYRHSLIEIAQRLARRVKAAPS